MGLVLSKEVYTVDTLDLYRVSAKVDGKVTKFSLQCLQTKADSEIETLVNTQLLIKGYIAEELTPVTWE